MGVPKLFSTLVHRYDKILLKKPNEHIQHIFFDLNCLIHPVCAQCGTNEEMMYEKICEYIQYVIDYINPSKMNCQVHLFIDGVAPLAKIQQQRQRRYKSLILKKVKNQFLNELNISSRDYWDSNQISPGTPFMENLKKHLSMKFPHYIISATDKPGEGEHKIVEYILKMNCENVCIYGLDADLILLSWIIAIKKGINVFLIRESKQFGYNQFIQKNENNPFTYMFVNKLIDSYYCDLRLYSNKQQESVDFVFLSFFLGNDFLPNLFGIQLGTKPDGLSQLLYYYKECKKNYQGFYLINIQNKNRNIIHWLNLYYLFDLIYKNETYLLSNFITSYLNYKPRAQTFENEIDKKMHEFENNNEKWDPIFIGTDGWEERYVSKYFYISIPFTKNVMKNIVDHYLAGLVWNAKYYFKTDENLSFGYMYPYMVSPCLKYILPRLYELASMKGIDDNQNTCNINYDYFYSGNLKPFKPLEALKLILPSESWNNIFKKEQDDSETVDKLDLLKLKNVCDYKHFWNEGTLILPPIEWKK
jgi:5'-3' exoribonuclease 1